MNRISQLFAKKREKVLSVFYTAGFPNINDTIRIAQELEKAGADILEIGIPYSDPMADGEVIQLSSQKALDNGMNLKLLFEQLQELRVRVSIPVLLMGYLNPVLQYGVERFCKDAKAVGIDGVILPDLPIIEYEKWCKDLFEQYGLANVFLVTPQTSQERVKKIDTLTNGFIYLLSSNSITGGTLQANDELSAYYQRVKSYQLKSPTLIGFGISNRVTFDRACENANGAIIGSAFIRHLEAHPNLDKIESWVKEIKG